MRISKYGQRIKQVDGFADVAAQLRVQTAAYLANETTCSIAAHTLAGQDFGRRSFVVEFNMLAPGRTETSITNTLVSCYERFSAPENSPDHVRSLKLKFTGRLLFKGRTLKRRRETRWAGAVF